MTDFPDIPAALRVLRSKLGLSQEQLAERLGVSFATVNRWESGANRPQLAAREAIERLAEEAGVDGQGQLPLAMDEAPPQPRRRRGMGRSKVLAQASTKSMEQMLWDAACSIRGEKDAPKFKDYLLPLLFVKRLSDVFDDEVDRLAEEYGDRETALEIAEADHSLLRFFIPSEARWGVISGRQPYEWAEDEQPKDIGEHLTKAVRAIVKQNPSLSGVIDVEDFAAERSGERDINPAKLRSVVETFSDPRYRLGLHDVEPDFLGRAYEYLLRKFAEGSGQSAGEFFTPTEVGFLMAHIIRPRPGEECHDFACGSAGLLIKLQLVCRELDPLSKVPLRLTGQELQAESYAIAQMNTIIHDMEATLARGDSMINPKFKTADGQLRTFDIVVANPMWNQPFASDVFDNDPFDRFRQAGGVTTGKGDWAWLQHALACLNERGRAAVILDTGVVTRGSGSKHEDRERKIRKWFVDNDLIDGVILLPDNLFYNTPAAGVIMVLNKRKPTARKDKIVLVNASRRMKKGRPKNYIPEEAVRPLAIAFLKGEPVEGEIAVITREHAMKADYNLSPSRWVNGSSDTDAGDLTILVAELERLSAGQAAASRAMIDLLRPILRNLSSGAKSAAD
jgi:type I restriction enzyme M protein